MFLCILGPLGAVISVADKACHSLSGSLMAGNGFKFAEETLINSFSLLPHSVAVERRHTFAGGAEK